MALPVRPLPSIHAHKFFHYSLSIKDDDLEVTAQNAGMIASYYYIRTGTVDIFSQALTARRKLKGLIDILCNAVEFEDIPVRRPRMLLLRELHEDYLWLFPNQIGFLQPQKQM